MKQGSQNQKSAKSIIKDLSAKSPESKHKTNKPDSARKTVKGFLSSSTSTSSPSSASSTESSGKNTKDMMRAFMNSPTETITETSPNVNSNTPTTAQQSQPPLTPPPPSNSQTCSPGKKSSGKKNKHTSHSSNDKDAWKRPQPSKEALAQLQKKKAEEAAVEKHTTSTTMTTSQDNDSSTPSTLWITMDTILDVATALLCILILLSVIFYIFLFNMQPQDKINVFKSPVVEKFAVFINQHFGIS